MTRLSANERFLMYGTFLTFAFGGMISRFYILTWISPLAGGTAVALLRLYKKLRQPGENAASREDRGNARIYGLWTVVVILILDQGTKLTLRQFFDFASMKSSETVSLLPFLKLGMTWNPGFGGGLVSTDVVIVIELMAISALVLWLWFARNQTQATALGLIVGGALGNFTDWLLRGNVADFVRARLFDHDIPAFNVADVAITLGVVVLILDVLLRMLPRRVGHAGEGS